MSPPVFGDPTRAFVAGRDWLGPLWVDFCARAYLYQAAFVDRGAVVLAIARAGLRIRLLFERWCARMGREPPLPIRDLLTSRLACCKGCLATDPALAAGILCREFRQASLEQMLFAVAGRELRLDLAPLPGELRHGPACESAFLAVLDGAWPVSQALRGYFDGQGELFGRYVAGLTGGAGHVLLLDSGWTGTIQQLLTRRFGDRQWYGVYFGRWDNRRIRPAHFLNTAGLGVDGETVGPDDPAAALLAYHHVIEDPLELPVPSVEFYRESAAGTVEADIGPAIDRRCVMPQGEGAAEATDGVGDAHFRGILACVEATGPEAGVARTVIGRNRALRRLARAILRPCAGDVAGLAVRPRSADFGRDVRVPVLLEPGPDRSPAAREARIARALWPAGQRRLEYPLTAPLRAVLVASAARRSPASLAAAAGRGLRALDAFLYPRRYGAAPSPARSGVSAMAVPAPAPPPAAPAPAPAAVPGEHDPLYPLLSETARALLPLPDTAESVQNLRAMANFLPLILPVMAAVAPHRVVEIGSDAGVSTGALAAWCRTVGARLSVVDPSLGPEARAGIAALGDHVEVYPEPSLAWLRRGLPAEIFFIDGDHNYYTVIGELVAISQAVERTPDHACVVFLHDIGWPWGRRDLFYDPAAMPEGVVAGRTIGPGAVLPLCPGGAEEGFGLPFGSEQAIAAAEGGPGNGVLTAVEDFLLTHPDWRFASQPAIYGLGVLWRVGDLSPVLSVALDELAGLFERLTPLAATLEVNRLRLLASLRRLGGQWCGQRALIGRLTDAHVRTLARTVARDGLAELVVLGAGGRDGLGPGAIAAVRAAAPGLRLYYYDHLVSVGPGDVAGADVLDAAGLAGGSGVRGYLIVSTGYAADLAATLRQALKERVTAAVVYDLTGQWDA